MRSLFGLLLLGAAGYMIIKCVKHHRQMQAGASPMITLKESLPAGARLTGVIQQTANTEPPGGSTETIGFAIKNWAEYYGPDGERRWLEVGVG